MAQLAKEDQDSSVRCAALARLTDLTVVHEIAEGARQSQVRAAAEARLCGLLAGGATDALDVGVRLSALATIHLPGVLERIARQGGEAELRIAALQRIESEAILADAAIDDPVAEVRSRAAERLTSPDVLEQVLRSARKKDKRVARIVKDKLDRMRLTQEARERIPPLCERLELLIETPEDDIRFQRIEREWEPLRDYAEEAQRQRFETAAAAWRAAHTARVQARAAEAEALAKKEAILQSMAGLHADLEDREGLEADDERLLESALHTFTVSWAESEPTAEPTEHELQARYRRLLEDMEHRRRQLLRDQERTEALTGVIAQAHALAQAPDELDEDALHRVEREWMALERPESEVCAASLNDAFKEALKPLREHLRIQEKQERQAAEDADDLLKALDEAVAAGELKTALALEGRVRNALERLAGTDTRRLGRLQGRLRDASARIQDLRGWRHWGTSRAREELIARVQTLVGDERSPEVVAKEVREARMAWRRLDQSGDRGPHALWEQFNELCNQAYAPCQAFFEAQAQQRREHLEVREAICADLERYGQSVEWDRVDWKEIDKAVREFKERWRAAGPVERKVWPGIEERYHTVLATVDEPLTRERDRCLNARRKLIERVTALTDEADLYTAIEETKNAQREWKVTVPAPQRVEQGLWRDFRAACDAVFARREAEREARERELRDNLERLEAICAGVEALSEAEADTIPPRLRELSELWHDVGPVPKGKAHAFDERFERARQAAEARRERLLAAARRAGVTALGARAEICARLEQAILASTGEGISTEAARGDWAELAPVVEADRAAMERRFARACAAVDGDGAAQEALRADLVPNLAAKRQLCIRMEVLAEVPSPTEFMEARMAYQVERLSAAMHQGQSTEPFAEALAIERSWYLTGPVDPEQHVGLEARFHQALGAFHTDAP